MSVHKYEFMSICEIVPTVVGLNIYKIILSYSDYRMKIHIGALDYASLLDGDASTSSMLRSRKYNKLPLGWLHKSLNKTKGGIELFTG